MALSRALFSGISGLKGQQLKLDVIGNNISNVNTIGFKKSRVTFSDLFSDTLMMGSSPSSNTGGTNPSQIGLGSATPKIEMLMTDGSTQTTGLGTDLAIAGEGFFVVGNGQNQVYTRDGNLKLDDNGDLVSGSSSMRIQGWMASRDEKGSFYVDPNSGLTDLNMQENRKMWAVASDFIGYSSNLDSSSSERSIAQAETAIHFRDNSSENALLQGSQKISFGFQMLDGNNFAWVANDTDGNTIATGQLKFNDFGEILESKMSGAGGTSVNYDWNDVNFPDILTFGSQGQIDPLNLGQNVEDGNADMVFNPDAENFTALSQKETPKAFSFTYDPDGAYSPGRWLNPNLTRTLSAGAQNLSNATLNALTGQPLVAAPSEYAIKNIVINNSWDNEVAGQTLQNYSGLSNLSSSGQIRIEVVDSIDTDPNKMDVIVYKNELGGASGGPNEAVIGRMFALDRGVAEHKITVPGLINFSISKSDVTPALPWQNSAAGGDELYFNVGNSGNINPTDNGSFFSGLPAGFHDGPEGPSKFEIRNIDASNSDYSGNLRIMFTGPTSYQIVDDNNVVLKTNSLRDDQRDVTIDVLGIEMVIHREGDSLKPKDFLENGFMGTEIRINGFQKAEGKSGPVTVSIPKFSELNAEGVLLTAETDINFDLGFSKAESVMRRGMTNDLATLNNTYPESSVTVDASRANSNANGSYRIEFGVRNAGADPYRPHIQDPAWNPATNGDFLDNQVLRVYVDGNADPAYIIDLNPKTNNTAADIVIEGVTYRPGDTLPLMDQDGNVVSDADFLPAYNFFAEMENYELRSNPAATISNTFLDQYESVNRQINLSNGVVINLSNSGSTQENGTTSASAFSQSANFIAGDSFLFSVENAGEKAGLEDIGTYSAAFQNGANHSTTIEVFDSLGGSHFVTTTFEHVNKNGKEWNYYLSLDPKDALIQSFLKSPPPGYTVNDSKYPTEEELRKANEYIFSEGRQGKLYFTDGGTIDRFNSYIPKAKFKPADASTVEVRLDMDLITQFEADFSTEARERNGNAMGILQGFTIEQDGKVVGSYTNGQKAAIAQLAVATFNNPDGLLRSGSNTFEYTSSSGLARIGKAGNDGRGTINSGTLESSNVDLTEEFTELIVTQRSFSANGRIITTSDEFLQEILSLKR